MSIIPVFLSVISGFVIYKLSWALTETEALREEMAKIPEEISEEKMAKHE
jgi:hypothetical protein